VEGKTGILRRFAACFTDHRDPERIEHSVYELLAQRIYALALGYEDLNDHDALRHDPLLAVLVGKAEPTGRDRRRREDRGKSLAGKSTLNRLELTPTGADETSRCTFPSSIRITSPNSTHFPPSPASCTIDMGSPFVLVVMKFTTSHSYQSKACPSMCA